MIIIGNTLISDDVCNAYFACNLKLCEGKCCIEGDYGAPLEEEEIAIIENEIEHVKPYMTPEGIETIKQKGVFEFDIDGIFVTPLITDRQCVFVFKENNIAFCAFEKAFIEKKINFRKPISCHLYPIRILKQPDYDAINYHQWDICKDACKIAKEQKISLHKYLKEPLIRKYGEEWYELFDQYLESRHKKRD
jgi:hypothetical protein